MKAIQIDGAIKRFTTIPKAWGNVICGYDTLSSSIWEEAGFYDVEVQVTIPIHNI